VSVLQRQELEASPLADLHAIAQELGLESYRKLKREELVEAIVAAQGGEAAGDDAAEDAPAVEDGEPDEVPAEEALEERGRPGGEEEPEAPEDEPPSDDEIASGVLDVLPNGSGFLRIDAGGTSRDDVYVSAGQIRRCELRAGDEVSGPVRSPRRNERHPSIVRIEQVNGRDAEPPEERPEFAQLTPVFASERLSAPATLESVPLGKGSRVAVGGPPGAGATTLLREIARGLAESHPDVELAVVLVGVRPEEVTDWRRELEGKVTGGGFDRSPEAQAQTAELAIERAKRRVERGGHAAVVIDSLESLPHGAQRRVFGAARNAEEGGSLTVIASIGMSWEPQRVATTRIVLDPPQGSGELNVSPRSGTLRADLLSG